MKHMDSLDQQERDPCIDVFFWDPSYSLHHGFSASCVAACVRKICAAAGKIMPSPRCSFWGGHAMLKLFQKHGEFPAICLLLNAVVAELVSFS